MIIGIPREIKNGENRVAITPAAVSQLAYAGHSVHVETSAGVGSGYSDGAYTAEGAKIVQSAKDAWDTEMVMKVKEPLPSEYPYFADGKLLFTYLHLAAAPELTRELLDSRVTGVAYETIQTDDGSLPLLSPMSEVAGRMSVQIGARLLEKDCGGKGLLLGGVPGVDAARVTVIGGGTVGINAARIALGMGARVTMVDVNPARLRYIDEAFDGRIQTIMSNRYNIARMVKDTDLLIGAVLITGYKAPCLVTEEMVRTMEPGSVIVDVAIDQGGCIETADRVTTHADPTYERHGVIHYAVANIPGAVARTSTQALTNATLPYALKIANKGLGAAAASDVAIARGVNTIGGMLTCKPVADSLSLKYCDTAKETLCAV